VSKHLSSPRWSFLPSAAAALGFVLAAAAAAQEPTTWTPDLALRYRSIEATAMSPNGELVAYVVRTAYTEGETSEFRTHIQVAGTDGERDVHFTRGEASFTDPAFSPDGRHLAFLSTRASKAEPPKTPGSDAEPPKSQIWVMPIDGGEAEALTAADGGVSAFAWSPDSRHLAFIAADPETEDEKLRKKEKRDVILVNRDFKYGHLYRVALAEDAGGGRETRRLTEDAFHVVGLDWSPDGAWIAFSHAPDPRINTTLSHVDLSRVPAAGGAVEPLVVREGVDTSPRYSPDGRWIAFTSNGGTLERVGLADVHLVPAEGGAVRALAHTRDRNATLVDWAPDSRSVVFTEADGLSQRAFRLTLDGEVETLTPGDGVFTAVSLDAGHQRLAWVWQDSEAPPEVWVGRPGESPATKVSHVNDGLPMPPMGRTERVSWTSTGGLPIEGLLTYPVGWSPGRRVPLVLNVHGGPAGVFSSTFTGAAAIYQLQLFAELGYAVLRPNPRGSTGYGRDFRYANVKDWGHGDFDDLMAGVDHAIAIGVADPNRLFLMGWSYGGYMTSYAVTRTARFRAASMGAGLPDLVSMVHTTDIPDYLAAHMGGELWTDYDTYRKHSAIYRLDQVTTPTQVIHGAVDLRVPFTQGQELFVGLERLSVPTEMVVYPRTPHGPREPKLLIDVSLRILDWFERHGGQPFEWPGQESRPAAAPTGAS
jgi:dipeptidyl aminopeptidase/acylaminoacyl peptidase